MQVYDLHKSRQVGRGLSVVFLFVITSATQACLWDWDTLQMERRRFPGTLEMITGKFVRHSPAYYEWRIQDRTKRMRSPAEDPALADDLAVAYSKLGRHAEGIALLEQVLAAHPDRYETLANLGTIHMLAGDLKVGKEYVDRAIVVNPDAHLNALIRLCPTDLFSSGRGSDRGGQITIQLSLHRAFCRRPPIEANENQKTISLNETAVYQGLCLRSLHVNRQTSLSDTPPALLA